MSSDLSRRARTGLLLGGGLALSLLVLACGNKESPQPPPRMIAAPTRDLAIQQRGSEVLLSFTYPTTTVAGFVLGPVQAVEIWELVQELPEGLDTLVDDPDDEAFDPLAEAPEEPPAAQPVDERLESRIQTDAFTFSSLARLKATLSDAELDAAVAGDQIVTRFPLEDEHVAGRSGLIYGVKTISERGLASDFSNLAILVRRETPPAPTPFVVEPGPASILLTWGEQAEPPDPEGEGPTGDEPESAAVETAQPEADDPEDEDDGILAYRVYRRDAHVRDYGEPLRELPPEITSVSDSTAILGSRYIYAVTAVIERQPVVETALSIEHEVDYQDRFPPPPPANVVVFVERDAVRLLWDASRSDDVLGYFVLRAEGAGELVQLNDEPIEVLEFVDSGVSSRSNYRYVVEAIDQTGNRGEPSREVSAQVP